MPRKKNTLKLSVYEALKRMIITGQLLPGVRITESELAKRLQVSRTPLREALNRLERDDLVTGRPRQGYTVKTFDLAMFREAFEVRELLEGHATELASTRATKEDKAKLRAMIAECERLAASTNRTSQDLFRELQVGIDIHRVIADIAGNEMLRTVLNNILDKCQHYVWMELMWLDEWRITRAEHAEIVEAICTGDAKRAGDLARKHVRESKDTITQMLQTRNEFQDFVAQAS